MVYTYYVITWTAAANVLRLGVVLFTPASASARALLGAGLGLGLDCGDEEGGAAPAAAIRHAKSRVAVLVYMMNGLERQRNEPCYI